MDKDSTSTPRNRFGLRDKISKFFKTSSSASGKSHLDVPKPSPQAASVVVSAEHGGTNCADNVPEDSVENNAILSLSNSSIDALPKLDVLATNSHVTRMWHGALEVVTKDPEMREALLQFEDLLHNHIKQGLRPDNPSEAREHPEY